MSCAGVRLSGHNRGRPCNAAVAPYTLRGKNYCAAHRTIASEVPGEFVAAKATLGRKLVRQEAAAAARAAQIDAFSEDHSVTM